MKQNGSVRHNEEDNKRQKKELRHSSAPPRGWIYVILRLNNEIFIVVRRRTVWHVTLCRSISIALACELRKRSEKKSKSTVIIDNSIPIPRWCRSLTHAQSAFETCIEGSFSVWALKALARSFSRAFVFHGFKGRHTTAWVGAIFIYRREKNNKLRAALKICEKSIKMGISSRFTENFFSSLLN